MSAPGFADHFSLVASDYARYRPTYPDALFDWIASLAPAHDAVWDCACGTGQAALPLADHFAQVFATDASEAQISTAPPHPHIRWSVAPAESSNLTPASVAGVTVAQALHWFDLPRFWAEVRRVVRPGGFIVAWSYGLGQTDDPTVSAMLRHFHDEVVGDYWPIERGHVDAGYARIEMPFARIDPPPIELRDQWTLDRLLGYLRTWSATQRYLAAKGIDPVVAFAGELQPRWLALRELTWPLTILAGRV